MTAADLNIAVEWAAAEGWNPGLDDAQAFRAADPNGFLMGLVDGVPGVCISVVRYGSHFGFLGFYICRPDLRGKGFGLQIWQTGMRYLEDRIVGLDGVVDQQDNYRKSGFKLAHNNIRFGGQCSTPLSTSAALRPIRLEDIEKLIEYDQPFFADDRSAFMTAWLTPSVSRHGYMSVEDGKVNGFGIARKCRDGTKIGPLFADSEEIAERLFGQLAASAGAAPVYLDVPATNKQAIALAHRHGLSPVFETARMYKGAAPSLPLSKTFGITTFELG